MQPTATLSQSEEERTIPPAVAAVRAKMLNDLTSVDVFAKAIEKTPRTVQNWIVQGLPVTYIGRTPYVMVDAARDWLMKRGTPNTAPRTRCRPKAAA
jgi:hypothetical protein